VLARGGGSLEDLAAFNTERVARAIVASRLPVVSAIGHETDFTIADFAADLRAPTPSAAAELITAAQHTIAEHLAAQSRRLERAVRFQLLQSRQRLTRLPVSRAESRLSMLLHRLGQRLDDVTLRLDSAFITQLSLRQNRIAELAAAVLDRGPRQNLAHARERLADFRARLDRCLERLLQSSSGSLTALDARLHSLSPLAVLNRGYALVLSESGSPVRSTAQIAAGDRLTTRLADGSFLSRVESTARLSTAPYEPAPGKKRKKTAS
jgi:exodeoxyribonuclease VII large subunit